ncbi:hypothetical protein, partial [Agathobaculum sp.]|uniref:hypothetical protein n=1 Tax=Agathobaculum sp. TaxID=2048138 RepID=UPI003AB2579E
PLRRGQRYKSLAELDFYGEFDAALCGAPVLPVLPKAKCGRKLRPKGAEKARLWRAFSYFEGEKVSAWELSDVRVLQRQNTDCRKNEVFRQSRLPAERSSAAG